jgi:large subunit ribosomal protein L2
MPVGTIVHNVELKPGKGGQLARSAGTYAQLVGRDAGYAQIRLSSGELRMVRQECMATIGAVSNPDNIEPETRQGRPQSRSQGHPPDGSRRRHEPDRPPAWRRRRPHLGRPSPGHPVGQGTKGNKTRKNKATTSLIVRVAATRRKGVRSMARSVWKGPFVDGYLLKKAEKAALRAATR